MNPYRPSLSFLIEIIHQLQVSYREPGGIRPPKRIRSEIVLSLSEREEISRGVVAGHSIRSIAATLRRSPSTVCREIKRNGGQKNYRANVADQTAWGRAQRPNDL